MFLTALFIIPQTGNNTISESFNEWINKHGILFANKKNYSNHNNMNEFQIQYAK